MKSVLNAERLALNQKFIDLINEYCNDNDSNYYVNGKDLMKYIWHRDFMLVPKDNTIYE